MAYADEYARNKHETRARKSVRYDRPAEHRWAQQPMGSGGPPRIRTNTRFRDNTGWPIIGLDTVIGSFKTGPSS